MTIEKRSNNSYRITQMVDGVRYHVTVDHKPTKDEAIRLMAKELERDTPHKGKSSLRTYCDKYISDKSNILSPSTIAGYRSIMKRIPNALMDKPITRITHSDLQRVSNDYSAGHSAKTVRNVVNFILSVLSYNDIEVKSPKMPQKERKTSYIPTENDISRILKHAKGTEYEVPLTLAVLGMRRSEICAVTADDLQGDILTISKAKVQDEHMEWVEKQTKTEESTRSIAIPSSVADSIRSQGFAWEKAPNEIYKALQRFQTELGIPHFPLHKMRHFYASYLHQKGYTDRQIQEAGGWKTDNVMKTVYRHAMEMEEAKKSMRDDIEHLTES